MVPSEWWRTFGASEALLLYVEKQRERAEQVVVVCEAGPLGFTLSRMLQARGVLCYVCAPDRLSSVRTTESMPAT
jgi:hypothetical protein